MRLYNSAVSGNCYKIRQLLAHLGQEYERIEFDVIDRSDRQERLGAKTPILRVPVLELDDGTCLPESNAILVYLAQGTEYLPDEPLARHRVLQRMFFEQNLIEPNLAVARFWVSIAGQADKYAEPLKVRLATGHHTLQVMDEHLAENRWFATECYTIADIALYAYTHTAADGGFELARFPHLARWLGDVAAAPGHIALED